MLHRPKLCLAVFLSMSVLAGCANYVDLDNMKPEQLERARKAVGENSLLGLEAGALKGLEEVSVGFPHQNELTVLGVSRSELIEPCELKLRLAGLKIKTLDESVTRKDCLLFYQNIQALAHSNGITTSYTISSTISDRALLERDNYSTKHWVVIWKTEPTLGYAGSNVIKEAILRASARETDKFLDAWLKSNGR
jgi:hypothetical protein